jgi:O-antigen/teichoic acid export membrane protein
MSTGTYAGTAELSGHAPAKRRILDIALRYGMSAFGPVAVSGAHFIVSVVFLRDFSRADFGLFSFLLVVVPFLLSLNGSLLGISITSRTGDADEAATHFKLNLIFAACAAVVLCGVFLALKAPVVPSLLLAGYGAMMTLRWFARSYAYREHKPFAAAASDIVYAGCVGIPVLTLWALQGLSPLRASTILFAASLAAIASFGPRYLHDQFLPRRSGALASYRAIWHDMTRWSLLGVVLTEATANAHSYLVTLISGPGAFALLAVGALLMRPVSLVFAALPDLERPAMARAIVAGDIPRAFRIVKEFRTAVGAMLAATVLAAGAILVWFPHLLLKQGYSLGQVTMVAALSAAIVAVRALRTPESVLLQAAGEFRPLARASLWSSLVSLVTTLGLLLTLGPVGSLGGILAGEGVMTVNIFGLSRRWRKSHG